MKILRCRFCNADVEKSFNNCPQCGQPIKNSDCIEVDADRLKENFKECLYKDCKKQAKYNGFCIEHFYTKERIDILDYPSKMVIEKAIKFKREAKQLGVSHRDYFLQWVSNSDNGFVELAKNIIERFNSIVDK